MRTAQFTLLGRFLVLVEEYIFQQLLFLFRGDHKANVDHIIVLRLQQYSEVWRRPLESRWGYVFRLCRCALVYIQLLLYCVP